MSRVAGECRLGGSRSIRSATKFIYGFGANTKFSILTLLAERDSKSA